MRRELAALATVVIIVALAWVGYETLFGGDGESRFVLVEVSGDVRHVDGLGGVVPAGAGQVIGTRERLITGAGGGAILAFGEENRLTLDAGASLRVLEVDASGVQVELEGGRVRATVRPGGGSLGVVANGRGLVATDADFTAVLGEDGTVGVESTRGEVGLTGIPGTVRVREGERLVVPTEGSPLVSPASESLLLYVAAPERLRTREGMAAVTGRTLPGATVRVGEEGAWTQVVADPKGAFSARVALAEGENAVRVEARDLFGNVAVSNLTVIRDTRPPAVGSELTY